MQSPKAKSTGKSGGVGGEATGVCGVRGELCKEVTEGGGFAVEIVMGGWVFEICFVEFFFFSTPCFCQ